VKHSKKQAGQIVIITLLILGVFSVIGASVVTQVIYEQKKATLEQKSKEAYYAAESGIEDALKKILEGDNPDGSINVGRANVDVSTNIQSGQTHFTLPVKLNSGEGFIFNLNGYNQNQVRLCWDKPNTSFVAAHYYTDNGVRKLYRAYVINSSASQNPRFINGTSGVSSGCANGEITTNYSTTLALPTIIPTVNHNYLVLFPAYQNEVGVVFNSINNATFPAQGTKITSQAQVQELDNQIVRELNYFISVTSAGSNAYAPLYFMQPVYVLGGITYAPGKNW
jgi:Tfp pilus assembly protein PilX